MSAVMTDFGIAETLKVLGIKDKNSGASTGNYWFATRGEEIVSYSPVNGEKIASVHAATEAELDS